MEVQAAFALQWHNRAGSYFFNVKYTASKMQVELINTAWQTQWRAEENECNALGNKGV